MRINENQKVTLTLGQLKRLVGEALAPASRTAHDMVTGIANSRRQKRELDALYDESVSELCRKIRDDVDNWISDAEWWDEVPKLEELINRRISRVTSGTETYSYSNNYSNNVGFTIEYSDIKELANKLESVINEYIESLNSVYADELKQISVSEPAECYGRGGSVVISRGHNIPHIWKDLVHPYNYMYQLMNIIVDGIKVKLEEAGYDNVDVARDGESEISVKFEIPSSDAAVAEAMKTRINENKKVTLTLGQLRELVKESLVQEDSMALKSKAIEGLEAALWAIGESDYDDPDDPDDFYAPTPENEYYRPKYVSVSKRGKNVVVNYTAQEADPEEMLEFIKDMDEFKAVHKAGYKITLNLKDRSGHFGTWEF